MLTNQELYDRIATHMLEQGEPAREGSACRYRLETDGKVLRCAVGCLISDAEYDPTYEGLSVQDVPTEQSSRRYAYDRLLKTLQVEGVDVASPETLGLLGRLQRCHDSVEASLWPVFLVEIGELYGLDTAKVPD